MKGIVQKKRIFIKFVFFIWIFVYFNTNRIIAYKENDCNLQNIIFGHQISILSNCRTDLDCMGDGRRCIQNRCEGFAGNTYVSRDCNIGENCILNSFRGHYDDRGTYNLIVIDGSPSMCGMKKTYKIDYRTINNNENERKIFDLGNVYQCKKESNDVCTVNLGIILPGNAVGSFALCGCSNVMSENACSSIESFNVPLGLLNIKGFGFPHMNVSSFLHKYVCNINTPFFSSSSLYESSPSASYLFTDLNHEENKGVSVYTKNSMYINKNSSILHVSCKKNSICVIPDFLGYEISESKHFIKAILLLNTFIENEEYTSLEKTNNACTLSNSTIYFEDVKHMHNNQNQKINLKEVRNVYVAGESDNEKKINAKKILRWNCRPDGVRRRCIISLSNEEVNFVASMKRIGLCGCTEMNKISHGDNVSFEGKKNHPMNKTNNFISDDKNCGAGMFLGTLEVREDNDGFNNKKGSSYISINTEDMQESSRRLQDGLNSGYITDVAANIIPEKINKNKNIKAFKKKECEKHTDCFSGMGQCVDGLCTGFIPDLKDERLIRCLEAYNCNIKSGDIPGKGITNKYMVIAISPAETCGTALNLNKKESLFANSNTWTCEEGNSESCLFRAGVGFRRNKTHTVEGVRLCGCPDGDMNGDNKPCNHVRDFFVPVGRLGIQECLTNAHCADKRFAYCIDDHCGGFLVSAASVGIKAFQCMQNKDCTLEKIAAKSVNEALKVLPVAANFTCGGESALDPDSIQAESLPCLIDMNNDGTCDINLGVTKVLGTSRLCGCSGQDRGGSGKACDQLEDFDIDLGMLNVGECIINTDCAPGHICAKGECLLDTLPPYVVQVRPGNDTVVVPPVKTIGLVWNENIEWGAVGKRIVMQSMSDPNLVWEIKLPDNIVGKKKIYSSKGLSKQYELSIAGTIMKVTFDTSLYSFPEGVYRLGYEYGFVNDLQKNPNEAATNIQFAISKDAGCPYLYLTGFSTENGNPNWLYEPIEPISGKAAWKGGDRKNLFIYWKKAVKDQPGNWVLDTNLDPSNFLAFPELSLMNKLPEKEKARPPSGTWMKWNGTNRIPQKEVIVHCTTAPDRTLPTLLAIEPKIGEVGWPIDGVIKMTFSKKMNYGHWATINIVGRDNIHTVTLVADWEANMRGEGKPIQIKDGKEGSIVYLHLPEKLKPGVTYDIVVEMGALTDLAYNPWGPVESGTLVFTTYGSSCPKLDNLGIAYILNSTDHFHGSVVQVGCAKGYTSRVKVIGDELNLKCTDGAWSDFHIDCKADCGLHPLMSNTHYKVERDINNNTQHGAKIRISCAFNAIQLDGKSKSQTIMCREGRWDDTLLSCGGKCGPFPSLGPNYHVFGSDNVLIGTKRLVKCEPPARSQNPKFTSEEIICLENGWKNVTLQCHVDCAIDFPGLGVGYILEGKGRSHGSFRTLKCAPGYISTTNNSQGIIKCIEGKWINDDRLDCRISCPDLTLGSGYDIKPLPGYPKNSHMSQIEITCNPNALRESGPSSEIITCTNGAWSLHTISCRASCGLPLDQFFGNGYKVSHLLESPSSFYKHGSSLKVSCADGATPTIGSTPQTIVCDDGLWSSENKKRIKRHKMHDGNKSHKDENEYIDIDLVCKGSCPFPKLEIIHKIHPAIKGRRRSTYKDGTKMQLVCSNGYSAAEMTKSTVTITCTDTKWTPIPTFLCKKDCESKELIFYAKTMNFYVTLGALYTHGSTRQVTCLPGFERITGPAEDKITCKNGHFTLPKLVCSVPTCSDNLKNGDEIGIDCGGSCPELCSNTCTDNIRNGDEEDIDCGGSTCAPCIPCLYPPDISHSYSVSDSKGKIYVDVKDINEKYNVPSATPIYIQCAESFFPSKGKKNRFSVIYCRGGNWDFKNLLIKCLEPTCSDGIQNGDEYGIDCGGSCPDICPTCYDGIQNGNEDYIDCGGTCDACASCSLASIKPFLLSSNTYSIFLHKSLNNDEQSGETLSHKSNLEHGVRYKIVCAKDHSINTSIICLNGLWNAYDGHDSLGKEKNKNSNEDKDMFNNLILSFYKLVELCEASENYGKIWKNEEFLRFRFPSLLEAHDKGIKEEKSKEIYCIYSLVKDFMSELEAECGALVYGNSSSKVAGFCEGSCIDKLTNMIKKEKNRCKSLEENHNNKENKNNVNDHLRIKQTNLDDVYHLLENVLEVFCKQKLNSQTKKKEYCFATAKETLNIVSNLNTLADARVHLQNICPSKSCFRSNLIYIQLLTSLSEKIELLNSEFFNSENEEEIEKNYETRVLNEKEKHPRKLNKAKIWNRRLDEAKKLHHVFVPFTNNILNTLYPTVFTSKKNIQRFLQENNNQQFTKANKDDIYFTGTAEYLKDLSNINTIIDLMCLEVEGVSCASFVLAVGEHNPVLGGINKYFSSSNLLEIHPCESKCYLEVTRKLGQALRNTIQLKKNPHPYDKALSSLMISYGRLYCQQSHTEKYCGELIFPDSSYTSTLSSNALNNVKHNSFISATRSAYEKFWYFEYTPPTSQEVSFLYSNCPCQIEFIGDGDCDLSCFVPECGYDKFDCLTSTMFPEIYLKAIDDFAIYNNCNLFRLDFSCNDDTSKDHVSCVKVIQNAIERNGCCTAVLFEVLRDLLEIDSTHPLFQSGEISLLDVPLLSSLLYSSTQNTFSSVIETDRSVAWVEQACQVSLDRTCSRGLQRAALSINMKVDNLSYNKLFRENNMHSKKNAKEFRNIVRKTIANLLAIPLADVMQMVTWSGSVDTQIIIDAGWLSNLKSFHQDVQHMIDSGALARALNAAIGGSESVILSNNSTFTQSNDSIIDELKLVELDDIYLNEQNKFTLFKEDINSTIKVIKESIKAEILEIQVPPVSSITPPSLPLYGTFGMGRMDATLPRSSCTEDLKLDLPKDTKIYEVYEIRFSGILHGARREVSCARSYDPIKGTSPQELVCDKGRWIPSGDVEKIVCRLPCEPYEKIDEIALRPEYIISGVGERSGDTRIVYCATGFIPLSGSTSDSETILCNNGIWTLRNITCVPDPNRSSGGGGTLKAIGGKCANEIQLFGEAYSVSEIGYSASDVPKEFAAALQTRFPLSTRSLQLLAINCARGFTSVSKKRGGKNTNNVGNTITGVGEYHLACLDGVLYGIGSEHPFGVGWIPKKILNMDNDEALLKSKEIDDKIQKSIVIDHRQMENSIIHLIECTEDVKRSPTPLSKPLNDTIMIIMILIGIILLFIILVGIIYIIKKNNQKKMYEETRKEQESAYKDKRSDITDAGVSVVSENDLADFVDQRIPLNDQKNVTGIYTTNSSLDQVVSFYKSAYSESEITGKSYMLSANSSVNPCDYNFSYANDTMVLSRPPHLLHARCYDRARHGKKKFRSNAVNHENSAALNSSVDDLDDNKRYSSQLVEPKELNSEITNSLDSAMYSAHMPVNKRIIANEKNLGAGTCGQESVLNWGTDQVAEKTEVGSYSCIDNNEIMNSQIYYNNANVICNSILHDDGGDNDDGRDNDDGGDSDDSSYDDNNKENIINESKKNENTAKISRVHCSVIDGNNDTNIHSTIAIEDNNKFHYKQKNFKNVDSWNKSYAKKEDSDLLNNSRIKHSSRRKRSMHKLQTILPSNTYFRDNLYENNENTENMNNNKNGYVQKIRFMSPSMPIKQFNKHINLNNNTSSSYIITKNIESKKNMSVNKMEEQQLMPLKKINTVPSNRLHKAIISSSANNMDRTSYSKQIQSSCKIIENDVLSGNKSIYTKSKNESSGISSCNNSNQRKRSLSKPHEIDVIHEVSAYSGEPLPSTTEVVEANNYLINYRDDRRFMNEDEELYPEDSASCVAANIHARNVAKQQLNLIQRINSRKIAHECVKDFDQPLQANERSKCKQKSSSPIVRGRNMQPPIPSRDVQRRTDVKAHLVRAKKNEKTRK